MPISHRQVEVFRAVMQAGGVTAAAQALHSSQPTLSREIGLMEQRLGYSLFERVGARLKPTAAALALFDSVQRHYQGLAQVQAQARALGRAEAQPFELLAQPALAHALVPSALAACPAAADAAVSITPAESPVLEAWMSEQRFDLALTERADAPSGCRAEVLADLDEVAVLPAGHALASRARLALSDFADQPFVSLADDDPYRAEIDQLFEQAAVGRRMRLQTHSAVAVCALVAQGLGVAVVNPLTALACASERLVVRPLNVRIPFRVTLLTPLHRPVHRVAAPLADALRAQLRSMTA
ncbi:LysR family transcriptional regulator [Inhella crocodyli]|uniref:LysR family transcriptional regulator n=1 Tax=Inhella crocodyli TaxID=2499851 RepID=A0A3S2XN65_9BURK|nr:LysR family transcriptional regulator [Inhella crocodyli]RVT83059.1 LysR family transcriptional regulator [Inhella crocodyli]